MSCGKIIPVALALFSATVSAIHQPFSDPEHQKLYVTWPKDVTAVEGSTVVLPCRSRNKESKVQWSINLFGMGYPEHVSEFNPRYQVRGHDGCKYLNLSLQFL